MSEHHIYTSKRYVLWTINSKYQELGDWKYFNILVFKHKKSHEAEMPDSYDELIKFCEEKGYTFLSAEVAFVPQTMTTIDDPDMQAKMEKLIDMLEENDDVQSVWHNWEMPDCE